MREILFRGKREDTRKWVYGHLHKMDGYGTGYTEYGIQVQDTSTSRPWSVPVIPETVGQYTGLDANGTKVFEGDILAFTDIEGRQQIEGAVVFGTFNCSCCDGVYGWEISGGDIRHLQDDNSFIKLFVIGNIHDNPELLRGGE